MSYKDPDQKRSYQREWVRKRRDDFFTGKSCSICGSGDNLELDHIDRSSKISSCIWSWSNERRNSEIAKCQILCHNCHVDKTWSIDFKRVECGTHTKYVKGCRCDECKAAHAQCKREYLAHKRSLTT